MEGVKDGEDVRQVDDVVAIAGVGLAGYVDLRRLASVGEDVTEAVQNGDDVGETHVSVGAAGAFKTGDVTVPANGVGAYVLRAAIEGANALVGAVGVCIAGWVTLVGDAVFVVIGRLS